MLEEKAPPETKPISKFEGIFFLLRTTGSRFAAAFPLECVELAPSFRNGVSSAGTGSKARASRRTQTLSKRNVNRSGSSRQTNPFFGFDRFAGSRYVNRSGASRQTNPFFGFDRFAGSRSRSRMRHTESGVCSVENLKQGCVSSRKSSPKGCQNPLAHPVPVEDHSERIDWNEVPTDPVSIEQLASLAGNSPCYPSLRWFMVSKPGNRAMTAVATAED